MKTQTITTPMAVDVHQRTATAIITAAVPDRSGDLILSAGLANRTQFLRNPVVLWAHQRMMPPIGTCLDLQVANDRIIAVTKFAAGVPLADDVFRLYEQGILRGWSIGFVPRRAGLRPPDSAGRRGLIVEAWDLLEYSAVPVPENPEALTLALRDGVIQSRELMVALRSAKPSRRG